VFTVNLTLAIQQKVFHFPHVSTEFQSFGGISLKLWLSQNT